MPPFIQKSIVAGMYVRVKNKKRNSGLSPVYPTSHFRPDFHWLQGAIIKFYDERSGISKNMDLSTDM